MMPMIREVCRIRFPERMFLASARGAHYFVAFVLLLITGSCVAAPLAGSHCETDARCRCAAASGGFLQSFSPQVNGVHSAAESCSSEKGHHGR